MEGHHLQKFINVEPLAPAVIIDNVYDETGVSSDPSYGYEDSGAGISNENSFSDVSKSDSPLPRGAAPTATSTTTTLPKADSAAEFNNTSVISRHSINLFGSVMGPMMIPGASSRVEDEVIDVVESPLVTSSLRNENKTSSSDKEE